ncbi:MAG: hypothetical protein LBU04_01150 [Christensenellaceae bacterium]|jgi:hypothetical protein|nr:hypothetical protein [Christensenellaceae bacterium]
MKAIVTFFLLTISTIVSLAQMKNCNRAVHTTSFTKRLPSDICLPKGYLLWDILADTIDINSDGHVDFVARLQKINVQDGDTTLVVLYKQNENGRHESWVTFNNLFPIYLKDYHYDYYRDNKDTSYFMQLRQRYSSPEFSEVFFEKDTIIVKFNTSGGQGLLLYFAINEKKDDWYLVKQAIWFGLGSTSRIEEITRSTIPKTQYNIKDFNMFDYLE